MVTAGIVPYAGCGLTKAAEADSCAAVVKAAAREASMPTSTPPAHLLEKLADAMKLCDQFRESDADTTEGDASSSSGTDTLSPSPSVCTRLPTLCFEAEHAYGRTPLPFPPGLEPTPAAAVAPAILGHSVPLRSQLRSKGSALLAELGQGRCNGRRARNHGGSGFPAEGASPAKAAAPAAAPTRGAAAVVAVPAERAAQGAALDAAARQSGASVAACAGRGLVPVKVTPAHVRGLVTRVVETEQPVKKRPIFSEPPAALESFNPSKPLYMQVSAFLLEAPPSRTDFMVYAQ